jgi:hypothetical protein
MSYKKMFFRMNENKLCISFGAILLFLITLFQEILIIKILGWIFLIISLSCLIIFLYKFLLLKYEIKNNIIEEKFIQIKGVDHIKHLTSSRSDFYTEFFGITIKSSVSKYIYLYKDVVRNDDDFSVYKKINKLNKIKLICYKKSKVIKEIKTNI